VVQIDTTRTFRTTHLRDYSSTQLVVSWQYNASVLTCWPRVTQPRDPKSTQLFQMCHRVNTSHLGHVLLCPRLPALIMYQIVEMHQIVVGCEMCQTSVHSCVESADRGCVERRWLCCHQIKLLSNCTATQVASISPFQLDVLK
jgi:hypothetical protein